MVTASIHADEDTRFDATFVASTGFRAVSVLDARGLSVASIFVTDDQARALAQTILAALDAKPEAEAA
jgi:hypothetical protein